MDQDNNSSQTMEDFRKSFFYGSRSDLNFKFLSMISDEKTGDFIQKLFQKIVEAHDTKELNTLFNYVINSQQDAYSQDVRISYNDGPFTPMKKKSDQARIMLFTSSGHFVKTDDPKPLGVDNMTQEEAESRIMEFIKQEPELSAIPKGTHYHDLMVRHGGYDIEGAKTDPNVAFPLEIFRELEIEKTIGSLADTAFSFVGACSQKRLLKKTGLKWVDQIKDMNVDAVFLVPV
jgi:hypothetical protein